MMSARHEARLDDRSSWRALSDDLAGQGARSAFPCLGAPTSTSVSTRTPGPRLARGTGWSDGILCSAVSVSAVWCSLSLILTVCACGGRSSREGTLLEEGGSPDRVEVGPVTPSVDGNELLDAATTGYARSPRDAALNADASPGAAVDGASCTIWASSYDQSCVQSTDCVQVTQGDYCTPSSVCRLSVINSGALARWYTDVSKTPIGSGAVKGLVCGSLELAGPCCRGSKCQLGSGCAAVPADTLAPCADAGGTCVSGWVCVRQGPPNSCAYPDETCCLLN
jgi:hypothetical protein